MWFIGNPSRHNLALYLVCVPLLRFDTTPQLIPSCEVPMNYKGHLRPIKSYWVPPICSAGLEGKPTANGNDLFPMEPGLPRDRKATTVMNSEPVPSVACASIVFASDTLPLLPPPQTIMLAQAICQDSESEWLRNPF